MSKKILIITSAVLILFLVSLLGYYFLTKDSPTNTGGLTSKFKNFFPFGSDDSINTSTSTDPNNNNQNGNENGQPAPQLNFTKRLRKLSVEPVSGMGSLDIKAGTVVRYIEKATGHIYEIELFSPRLARISNTTIPLSYDALWNSRNDSILARYLKDDNETIDTYSLLIDNRSTTTENITKGVLFPENINDVSVYKNNIFYLVQNTETSSGYVSSFDGKNKKQIWSSEIKELNSQFVNDRTVALTTKPYADIPGYLYTVDTGNGVIKKILSNIDGLSANISSDLSKVLYIEQAGNVTMSIYEVRNKINNKIGPPTLPEKCLWSIKNKDLLYCAVPKEYLNAKSQDMWYKGMVSFNDDIWMFDTKNNTSSLLLDLTTESGEKIDIVKPMLSENEQYLIFMNKIDNSLWSLDLTKSSTTTSSNYN